MARDGTFQSSVLNGLMNRVTRDLIGATLKESDQSSLPSFVVVSRTRATSRILTFLSLFPLFLCLLPPPLPMSILTSRVNLRYVRILSVSSNEITFRENVQKRLCAGEFLSRNISVFINRAIILNSRDNVSRRTRRREKKTEKNILLAAIYFTLNKTPEPVNFRGTTTFLSRALNQCPSM